MREYRKWFNLFLVAVLLMTLVTIAKQPQAAAAPVQSDGFTWDNATVYFAMTDRFYNGDPANDHSYDRPQVDATGKRVGTFHGGDVKGLAEKLREGYFQDLGVNAIWITAPYEQIHGFVGGGDGGDFAHYAYHGYYALDYTEMDQNMGTIDDMRDFVDTAHSQGIRVIVDIVMNHVGYNTLKDMEQYHFGAINGVDSNWSPGSGETWHTYHNYINYDNANAWSTWWGDWVRTGIAGYEPCGGSEITQCLSSLPDLRTEVTSSVGLPPILQTKWSDETTDHDAWIVPAAKGLRQDLGIAPADYEVKWLSAWVQEFGIDGFRVDTAKHVELNRWQQLKNASNAALQTWRQNNPTKPGADWTDPFWMTGEVWGHGVGKDQYFDNGFDSLINFSFQGANMNNLENTYSSYANAINSDPNFNVLSYISSHDTSLYDRNNLVRAGTALLLLPGAVQIFYGDESGRPFGETGSDPAQGTRSDMNWSSINADVLAHWQKLGQFRKNHVSIGAGQHTKISDGPYTFSRVYSKNGVEDKVVAVTGASGSVNVNVAPIFPDGTLVRDAYTGNEALVSGGKAVFTADSHGTILIEQAAPSNQPSVSASPGGGTFKTESVTITLHTLRADESKYTLDGSDPQTNGIAFVDGTTITIGEDMAFDQSKTLALSGSSSEGTASAQYTFTKKDPNAGLTVHFKKPADWGAPQLYYYQTAPATSEPTWSTAPAMTQESGGWYAYTIQGVDSARVIFKDNNGHQNPAANQPGMLRDQEGWYDGTQWSSTSPEPADTMAPSAPTGLGSTGVTGSSATLYWTASTDNVGVVGYDIYRDNVKVGTSTTTSYTNNGLTANTSYSYKVKARDGAGNVSAFSVPLTVTTTEAAAGHEVMVYYKKGYNAPYIHYRPAGGTWTAVPGVRMPDAEMNGYAKITIDIGAATQLEACFNDGNGNWDSNNANNYFFNVGTWTYAGGGVITAGPPAGSGPDTIAPSAPTNLASTAKTDSSITLTWTASTDNVGVKGYNIYRDGVKVGASTTAGYTDSALAAETSYQYTVSAEDEAGNVSAQSAVLMATTAPAGAGTGNQAEVYYYTKTRGWSWVNIHYAPTGGSWTTPPGVGMDEIACTDWVKKTVVLGTATGMKADFNNGSTWDNNNGADYMLGSGLITVKDGVVTAGATSPCTPLPPDVTPPSAPLHPAATANHLNITVTWDPSVDDEGGRGLAGYEITRTGGTQGTKVFTRTGNSLIDSGLDARTTYTYTIKAYDKAIPANMSASSAAVSAMTGDAPPPPVGGTPIGTDMREDSIYFVMTARFYDGDPSNDRGGQFNVSSGNAANNDPMFRGDFKGLIEKLDYIKALGFSAIWITPVVLNRSDYDFHGYHGYDFYRVDPRLESSGASYQDLINAAHNKGIKIIQDVVYNHSSRWGAKGLFTPTVFGLRDSQWSWYYDEPVPGLEYDGLYPESVSAKAYNGDLWSTEEPVGNTCANWGTPTQYYSQEGYRIYNCQWPSPTSGMFPAEYYHQCWIGNWEGEDSRSCWLHEDLADFNTESKPVQDYLIGAYNNFIDMGVDGFRIDTAVHIPRVTWNRRFLPAAQEEAVSQFGDKGKNFFMFGEVGAFVNDKWNRGSVNHSEQFFTWKERNEYSPDDEVAAIEQYNYEEQLGPGNQPTSDNAFLHGNDYHAPDHSKFSGMNIIDMRMHMNFSDAQNAFNNGKDSDDSTNDATYNVVYVSSHDFGPNKSQFAYNGGTDAWAENMSLMWTFRGIPTILYGDEIEFQAGVQIDCGPTCPLATTRRAYFGDHIEGSVVTSDFGKVESATGAVATTLQAPLAQHLQRLNQIRRAIPALQKGQYSTEGISGSMAYKRRYTDAAAGVDSFALITVSDSATFSGIPNGTYTDAITGNVKTVTNGTLTAEVSGKGNMRIYVLDLPGNPAPGKIGADGPFLK